MSRTDKVINTMRLRCILGWLGLLLPWICAALTMSFPSSISTTFYTNASTAFMIILGSVGFLLICYRGYEPIDDIINTIAGCFGLLICLFPCKLDVATNNINVLTNNGVGIFMLSEQVTSIVHNASAFGLFGLLAFNSLFLFTKTSGDMTKQKKKRNIIFRVCGIGMLAAFLLMLLPAFTIKVWLVETIALFFFAVSWLTKANCYKFLFCDDF